MSGGDYAFAPGGDPVYDERGRLLFLRKPNCTLIQKSGVKNVEAFIKDLVSNTGPSQRPIGDLFILSHGNDKGWMEIDLDSSSTFPDMKTNATFTTYEVLLQAVQPPHSVLIPDSLHISPPNPPVQFNVHIRGCRIGGSPVFVAKLKEAFGTPTTVTAPLHMHFPGGLGIRGSRSDTSAASMEYLAYSFELFRPSAPNGRPGGKYQFKTKGDAVDAFDKGVNGNKFKYIENGAVPPVAKDVTRADWEKWIPDDQIRTGTRGPNFEINLGVDIGDGRTKLPLPHLFRHEAKPYHGGHTVVGLAADPGNNASRLAILRDDIKALPEFQSTFPLPMYLRYGYTNFDDFFDGFTWTFTWRDKKKQLFCQGTRHVYMVMVPVVDPDTDLLFFNGYSAPAQGYFQQPSPKPLLHTDKRLFLTVTLVDTLASITELVVFGSSSCTSQLPISAITASGNQAGHDPQKVLDNNPGTRWANDGVGSWISADLGANENTCSVKITWYEGDKRRYPFVLATSSDGSNFDDVFTGHSSGITLNPEEYSFHPASVRYIRITVNGNIQIPWLIRFENFLYMHTHLFLGVR